jgi:hypothetical protein
MKFKQVDLTKINKSARKVTKVFLHCSDSDHAHHDNAETIEAWHKERGWSGIGYHFFVQKNGTIQYGRDIELVPAAQKGHNTGSIAICVHGKDIAKFTKEQRASLVALCLTLNKLYKGGLTFHGHKEVEPNKACPVFNYKLWLRLDKDGRMGTVL